MIKVLFLSSFLFLVHEPSLYDPDCCNQHDCKPVSCVELKEQGKQIIYQHPSFGKKEFGGHQIRESRDKQCHVCISNMGTARCVYLYYKGHES
jgi:hypothetical protein